MKIAIEGCCHGELDAIYQSIEQLEARNGYTVELLLICGDFQAVRNHQDLQCMAVPPKYRELKQFYKYYTGEIAAPILTIVIGGNHEASNYMWELYHGGWLAPNIYFLGHAGCVNVDGIRIAGASGIFKGHDFRQGHWEKLPYDSSSMRSIYHIREFNVRKLSLLSSPRIFLSHDWPQSIEHHGNLQGLVSKKRFLQPDIDKGTLGSPPLMGLLYTLKPEWWFSAHLHTRFEATVVHRASAEQRDTHMVRNPDEILIGEDDDDNGAVVSPLERKKVSENPEEIVLDEEEETVEPLPTTAVTTKFLALDKCLPRRQFLEVVDVPLANERSSMGNTTERRKPVLSFDMEWLAITRAFHPWFSRNRHQRPFPEEEDARKLVEKEKEWLRQKVKTDEQGLVLISNCQTFSQTAPGPGTGNGSDNDQQPGYYANPQTEAFCRLIGIDNKMNANV